MIDSMKKLILILIIGWIGFIFFQGSRESDESFYQSDVFADCILNAVNQFEELFEDEQPTSSNSEKLVVEKYLQNPSSEELFRQKISFFVRKSAHFFEYGVLAVLLAINFYLFRHSWYNQNIYTLFIVLLIAVLDEFYQSFIGRTSSVLDVMIDFSGAIFGVLVIQLMHWFSIKQADKLKENVLTCKILKT